MNYVVRDINRKKEHVVYEFNNIFKPFKLKINIQTDTQFLTIKRVNKKK